MTLYVLSYNNYYNRLVKVENNIEDYQDYILYNFDNVNFNPNDGVTTQHIIGGGNSYSNNGDYVLITDMVRTPTNRPGLIVTKEVITSRWFIVNSTRTRSGQWSVTLKRDVVADYYNIITQSPMFIEKATLDMTNPLLFNNENFSVNQIKEKDEKLLTDATGCPWIVGYYPKNAQDLSGTVNVKNTIGEVVNAATIEAWEFYKYYTTETLVGPAIYGEYRFVGRGGEGGVYDYSEYRVNQFNGNTSAPKANTKTYQLYSADGWENYIVPQTVKKAFIDFGLNNLNPASYANTVSEAKIKEALYYNGRTIKTLDGKYYAITVTPIPKEDQTVKIQAGALFNQLSTIVANAGFLGTPTVDTFTYVYQGDSYKFGIKDLTELATSYDITGNASRVVTEDAPYNLIAIPYGEVKIDNGTSTIIEKTNKELGMSIAASLIQSEKLLDIQLLPYFPAQELISDKGTITVTNPNLYTKVSDNSGETPIDVGVIFNIPKSTFTFDITDVVIRPEQSNISRKLSNECDKWRLTSPNYSSYFDFSAEKNNGVQYFNVDCTYKPYSPYIHVNPNFKNLYGYDDNSPRGLILGGDFSLTQTNTAWTQYQIQNKNFQQTFDRQIQNMEVQNKYQREMDVWNTVTGTVSGGVTGAGTGLIASGSNPYAAIGGAAVGTVASGLGGIRDLQIKDALRAEAIDYTKDNFGYQLGNIQALPQTISKVSALNANNKIFPILEHYSCTEVEKRALANKLAWNGMTVMTIGVITDYLGNSWTYDDIEDKGYIKGQVIRLDGIKEGSQVLTAISDELYKGVYIKQ